MGGGGIQSFLFLLSSDLAAFSLLYLTQDLLKQSINMERCSEEKEMIMRAKAAVVSSGNAPSLFNRCKQLFGLKAFAIFEAQFVAAQKYRAEEVPGTTTSKKVVSMRKGTHRMLQLELGPLPNQRWSCECGDTKSFGVPCRHIIAHLRTRSIEFDAYQAYFHARWALNRVLPNRTLKKVASSSSVHLSPLLSQPPLMMQPSQDSVDRGGTGIPDQAACAGDAADAHPGMLARSAESGPLFLSLSCFISYFLVSYFLAFF